MKRIIPLLILSLLGGCAALRPPALTADSAPAGWNPHASLRFGATFTSWQFVNCAPNTPCTLNGPINSHTGDPAYLSFYKLNTDITQLSQMFGASSHLATSGSANSSDISGLWSGCSSSDPILSYTGSCVAGGSQVYPGAGVANSTGTGWGTSYSSTNPFPANFLPAALANSTSINSTSVPASAGTLIGTGNLGTGVDAALGVNVGTAGAFVVNGGAGGTPSSLTLTNATGLPISGLVSGSTNTIVGNAGSGEASLTPAQAIQILNNGTPDTSCTTSSFTFTTSDPNVTVICNSTSAITVCIPPNSSVNLAANAQLIVSQIGTGLVTITPAGTGGCAGTGVTTQSAAYGSSATATFAIGQYGYITLQQTSTLNTWNLISWVTPTLQEVTSLSIASEMRAYLSASTPFTYSATGCTPSAAVGGPFGGKITLAAGPCTSIVVTMNGATGFTDAEGYDCSADDETLQAAGTWFGKWGASADTTTTATMPIPPAAGATDVISFVCHPRSL